MTIRRMEHVGIVVGDLAAAVAFFLALGFEHQGEGAVSGEWVDRIVGLDGVRAHVAMLQTPDGGGRLELSQFDAPAGPDGVPPAPANAPGLRHLAFQVDDIDAVLECLRPHGGTLLGTVERYGDRFRLCYVRGPEGIIVELVEQAG